MAVKIGFAVFGLGFVFILLTGAIWMAMMKKPKFDNDNVYAYAVLTELVMMIVGGMIVVFSAIGQVLLHWLT